MSPSVYCCGSRPASDVPAKSATGSIPGSDERRIASSGFETEALGIGSPPSPALGIGALEIGAVGDRRRLEEELPGPAAAFVHRHRRAPEQDCALAVAGAVATVVLEDLDRVVARFTRERSGDVVGTGITRGDDREVL